MGSGGPVGTEPIGGQALVEGVMMRRGDRWGAAVRQPDGRIVTISRSLPPGLDRARKLPLVRGVLALAESVGLGTKAMAWAARTREPEDGGRGYSGAGVALSTLVAAVLALGLFGVAPGAVAKLAGVDGRMAFNLTEGAIRVGLLLTYLWTLSRSAAVRRVFAFHGAEHMTIHAFEHGEPLEPERIRAYDRRHPRCGTSFLLIVAIVSIALHVVIGTPSWPVLIGSRIIGLPVVAAVAYEVVRTAGRHRDSVFGRVIAAPGSWLQSLTTQEPDDDQIEVAVAALQATFEGSPVQAVGAVMLAPPPRPLTRSRQKVVLVVSLLAALVEIAGLMELIPLVRIGRLSLSPSVFVAFVLACLLGRRMVGRARDGDAAATFWLTAAAGIGLCMVLLDREGHLVDALALMVAGLDEELIYRFAVPTVIAAVLLVFHVRSRPARITGLVVAGIWFVLLPGHRTQVHSAADVLPFIAFATLAAIVVYRSGSILAAATTHAVMNMLTIIALAGDMSQPARSVAVAVLLVLLVSGYGFMRPQRVDSDAGDGTIIDLRDGVPPTISAGGGPPRHVLPDRDPEDADASRG